MCGAEDGLLVIKGLAWLHGRMGSEPDGFVRITCGLFRASEVVQSVRQTQSMMHAVIGCWNGTLGPVV
jgi:hypothetical protein